MSSSEPMPALVVYVHGKGGSAAEAELYRPLFPDSEVLGLDYHGAAPWEAGPELRDAMERLRPRARRVTLIANSIGAFFSMHAGVDAYVDRAFFISPIVDMENLIGGMMRAAHVSEAELEARGVLPTPFGEDLSWEYLSYVRSHPLRWAAPTAILYGEHDALTSLDTITAFAEAHGASLRVMPGGEHWFHTPEQLRFLAAWILES